MEERSFLETMLEQKMRKDQKDFLVSNCGLPNEWYRAIIAAVIRFLEQFRCG